MERTRSRSDFEAAHRAFVWTASHLSTRQLALVAEELRKREQDAVGAEATELVDALLERRRQRDAELGEAPAPDGETPAGNPLAAALLSIGVEDQLHGLKLGELYVLFTALVLELEHGHGIDRAAIVEMAMEAGQ